MAQIPARSKYRKQQKGSLSGKTKAGQFVDFGDYGMQVLERGKITHKQIEACRVAITRYFSRKGKVWIRIFPDKPITKKPAETRMGKGKGATDHWVAQVRPGKILLESQGRKKVKEGTVVSNKMNKTVTINVERTLPHPRYKKIITRGKKYYAHNEKGDLKIGQRVRIRETRPLSKLKRWIVTDVLS